MDSSDELCRLLLHKTIKYLTLKENTSYLVPVFHGLLQKQLGENRQMELPRDGHTTVRTQNNYGANRKASKPRGQED
jgi:hypothetical protein